MGPGMGGPGGGMPGMMGGAAAADQKVTYTIEAQETLTYLPPSKAAE